MNTTPDFDEIGRTVPLEPRWYLMTLAALRICFVAAAMYVCALQLLQIGFWSGLVDRAIVIVGLLVGLGIYADGGEVVWRKLGVLGRLAAFFAGLVLFAGAILAPGNPIWSSCIKLFGLLILGSMAFGLVHSLIDPSRTLRFRQIKKYLRTLPKEKRRAVRQRLELNFQTLIAEGFD